MVVIRETINSDSLQIALLFAELGYPIEADFVSKQLKTLAEGGVDWMFVAEEGDLLVGLISYHEFLFHHLPGLYGRIMSLVVKSENRRQGVGKQLVTFLEGFACARGCVRLELNCANRREDAHEFYESLGYVCDSKRFVKSL